MAQKQTDPDLMTRLTGAGEEAMQRLTGLPGGKALVDSAQSMRERLDDLAARLRAIDPLEKRVTAIEKRLTALEKASKPARQKPAATTRKKTATRKET